jgi:hypothetical protein
VKGTALTFLLLLLARVVVAAPDAGSIVVLVRSLATAPSATEEDNLSRSRGAGAAAAGDCSLLILSWLELLVTVEIFLAGQYSCSLSDCSQR